MSFERKRRISIAFTSAYFLTSALVIGYVVGYHAIISCCGVVLLALTAPLLFYGVLAHHSMKDFRRTPEFIDPAKYGISIGTANIIRFIGLLLPLPLLAYGVFFASGMSFFSMDGSPASFARTMRVIEFDHKVFGHRMAQRECRRAARIHTWKHNYRLAQAFIAHGLSCAEEHTAEKPSRRMDLHYESGKIAARSGDWSMAENEFSTALQIAKDECGCDEDSRIVKRLTRRINEIREEHLKPIALHNCSVSYDLDPQAIRVFTQLNPGHMILPVNGIQVVEPVRYHPLPVQRIQLIQVPSAGQTEYFTPAKNYP